MRDLSGAQESIPDLVPGGRVNGRVAFKWKSGRQANTGGQGYRAAADEGPAPIRIAEVQSQKSTNESYGGGAMVELTGLQSTQDLNGRIGIIRDFDPSTTRYTVELIEEDGSTRNVLVRQANIDLLCPPEESQDLPKEAQAQASPAQKPQAKQTTKSEPVRAAPVAEEPSQTAASLASELANAVESCNLFQVQALLRDRADPNGRSRADVPLLMEAASATRGSGHLDLLALLLGWRADPETLLNRERRHKGTRAAFSSEAVALCQIFQKKDAESDEERAVLYTLEPGALAQARRQLKLPGPFAMGGTSPASCLQAQHDGLEVHCEEMEATSAHRLWLYSLDRLRPVLLMRPSGCQPTALMVFLHGLFQSAQMLECMVRDLSSSLPHVLFVMPTAPTRDAWGVGPAWFDHTRSAKKAESLEACRTELLALLSSQGQEWGIPPERVVLAGFSMGGTVAAWTALQVPRCLAGLLLFGTEGLSFTGGWASPKTLCGSGSEWATGADGLQVLQCHGREDTLCPLGFATTCTDELRKLGCSVRSLAFRGVGHALSFDMLEEAKLWLQQRIP
ncbi:Acyl-protein thioesterase 2 (APT-2) (Lysophospholipase II) (LPL-II) (LysoPLA II) [Durusdinium trenchii]|uniref:Acyl-protein thioesterase 2 (APT-2) (Lysophospholipase II) (LPL-II) (LysoPLA II) n=1 Tax=Durusdinium trenchii TaxID=1381693 RepID=A0ABP0LHW3_9DINO